MKVLVTRPAAQAAEWVGRLRAAGLDADALPLIGIDAPADAAPVDAAWAGLAGQRLVVFVSPNAVERFFARRPPGVDWPAATLAGSPGPGTTRALAALGVPAAQTVAPRADAAQFDSESLWAELSARDWHRRRVTIVRGDGGREWLADTLRAAGAEVSLLSAYRRAPPVFDAAQRRRLADALAAPEAHLWFFSSSEAIDHLARAAPGAAWRAARAIGTHPRIVERAQRLGVGEVRACRPEFDAVVRCIQSFDAPTPP